MARDEPYITREQAAEIAEEAAELAVNKVFLRMGIDLETGDGKEQLARTRTNLEFLEKLRISKENITKQAVAAAVIIVVSGLLAIFWNALFGTGKG